MDEVLIPSFLGFFSKYSHTRVFNLPDIYTLYRSFFLVKSLSSLVPNYDNSYPGLASYWVL